MRLRGMVDQVAQEQRPPATCQSDDMGGVRGEIEGAAAEPRDDAHQRMDGGPFSLSCSSALKSKPARGANRRWNDKPAALRSRRGFLVE